MRKLPIQRLIIAICSLLLIGTAAIATAQTKDITLGCGGATGAYMLQLCPALQKAMEARGFNVQTFEGQGSGANIASVKEGTRTGALVQMDVLAQALLDDPSLELFLPLGQISPEALFMVVKDPKAGGRVTDFSTLAQDYPEGLQPAKPFKVGVAGTEKSGSYLTMQTLMKNIPGLTKNVTLKPLGDMSPQVAYNYLNSGVVDVVMFVMMPDITNERLSIVIESKVWKFLNVNDPRITAINFSGQPVYSLMDIPLKGALSVAWSNTFGKDTPILRTAVTTATLLVDPSKTPDKVVRALSEVANAHDLLPDKSPTGAAKRWFEAAKAKITSK
ncbi:MAG: hypothetical protein Q8R30_01705 [bacterium]|nr:hypothetical protein [bacterium]